MASQEFNIEEIFDSAVAIVRNLPKEGPIKPSDSLKLKLYALFKQATHGPNDTPKPKFYQFVESYKWDAWQKLGDMRKEDAMAEYIEILKQIMDTIPQEQANTEDTKHFEEILGKKFYEYWFNEWRRKSQENDKRQNTLAADSWQSVEADGYKTPITLEDWTITNDMDQFSSAVLRLQQGLDDTNRRLAKVEVQVSRLPERIKALENQKLSHVTTAVVSSLAGAAFYCLLRDIIISRRAKEK